MGSSSPIRFPSRAGEEGYALVAVIFLVALLTISLAIAMPKVAKEIQRDRELETMQRGKQYMRAVRMYYKKFGAYPPNVDALVKPTNNIRFLRKKYADPTTGKEDWKPVLFGMNKAPTAMGFFGQPLGAVGTCAASTPTDGTGGTTGIGGIGGGALSPTSGAGSSNPASTGCSPAGLSTTSPTTTGMTPAGGTTPADPNAAGSTSGQSALGQPGQTFGGAGIIGFSPNSPKQSIMVYKTKTHYNEWEFVYDPKVEQMLGAGSQLGAPVQPGGPGLNPSQTPTSLNPTNQSPVNQSPTNQTPQLVSQ
jgi:type II secretory pathway pseudopilin PulG